MRSGADRRRSRSAGVCSLAVVPRSASVGRSSRRKRGSLATVDRSAPARLAEASVVSAASWTKRPTLRRLRARPARTVSASRVSWRKVLRLASRMLQDLVGLAQRRDGAAQRRLDVLAAGGDADPELGEQEPEALARGPAQDVEHEVGRDRARGLLDGDRARRRAGLPSRVAVEVVLADERLRLDLAEDVLVEAGEARQRDGDRRERAGRRALDVELLDLADDDPLGAQVRALGEAEGVVEHDRVALVVRRAGRGHRERRGARDRERQQGDEQPPDHGPIGTWEASQLKSGVGL